MINDEVFTDPLKCKETDQNRLSIPKFVAELDRYKVSDAAGAALATALMEDLELNTHDNTKLVFDKFKIKRQRVKNRKSQKKIQESNLIAKIRCIGTDGKRDKKTKVITSWG